MNILFDFISLQDKYINGASEYAYVVLRELLKNKEIRIFGIYNKKKEINATVGTIIKENKIELVDINDKQLTTFIHANSITVFYIAIGQRYTEYNLQNIDCKILITIHDVGDLCQIYDDNVNSKARYEFEKKYVIKHSIKNDFKEYLQRIYNKMCKIKKIKKAYSQLSELFTKENIYIITISEYSKYSLLYFFPNIKNAIVVFSSPHKMVTVNSEIKNSTLRSLVESKKEYLLLLNCTRRNKNTALFAEQWEALCKLTNHRFTAVLLGDISLQMKDMIIIPELSDSDLEHAYKNAFCLVYPSITEGYGYPPMEAMKYGTPTVCSNATSLPEVYNDSVLYFNPYYPEDLFRAIIKMTDRRKEYAEKGGLYYKILVERQNKDLDALIRYITK